jgi:hypothetical protein
MLIAQLGAERQVDFSSQILGELKQMARSEYIAFVFCLPLLLLAEVFSQGKLHTPFFISIYTWFKLDHNSCSQIHL